VDSSTLFERFDEANPPMENTFASLLADQIVEAEGDILSDGTLSATEVKLENETLEDELTGTVVGVTRDALGQVNSFTLVFFELTPCAASLPNDDLITVNVPTDGSVRFRIQDEDLVANLALFDDPSDLEVGQKIDVDPVEIFDPATTTYTADKIKLKRQTLRGTVLSLAATTFELDPAADLLPDQVISVETSVDTRFDNPANSVADLTVSQAVRVKGLLLRDAAGELTLVALRVRPE
jgi:hypothetical protein